MKRLPVFAAVVLGVIVLAVFSSIVTQGFQELSEVEDEHRMYLEKKARLERSVKDLQGTLEAVRTDPAAAESLARRDLGWVRPGERVILLATPTPPPQPGNPDETPVLTLARP